jgi:hypothetical protein
MGPHIVWHWRAYALANGSESHLTPQNKLQHKDRTCLHTSLLYISAISSTLEMTEYSPNDLADVRRHLLQLVSRPLPPFPGPEPDIEQRRTYVEAFLSQCFPRENTEDARKLLCKDATIIAAKPLIQGRITISTVARFAWEVNKVFWDLWCEYRPYHHYFHHWLIKVCFQSLDCPNNRSLLGHGHDP